jgi:anti-sigma regulatory factor (Ser/Thr protein kinase)
MPEAPTTARCRWRLPAEPAVLPLVRESVSRMMGPAAADDLERVRLAVTEACANVVRHAYPDDRGLLDVGVCLGPQTVRVEVRDSGIGVCDEREPPGERGGGLGLPLIDMLADRVEITPQRPGTSVRMTFDLQGTR